MYAEIFVEVCCWLYIEKLVLSLPPYVYRVDLRNFAVEKGSIRTTLPVMMKVRDETGI